MKNQRVKKLIASLAIAAMIVTNVGSNIAPAVVYADVEEEAVQEEEQEEEIQEEPEEEIQEEPEQEVPAEEAPAEEAAESAPEAAGADTSVLTRERLLSLCGAYAAENGKDLSQAAFPESESEEALRGDLALVLVLLRK